MTVRSCKSSFLNFDGGRPPLWVTHHVVSCSRVVQVAGQAVTSAARSEVQAVYEIRRPARCRRKPLETCDSTGVSQSEAGSGLAEGDPGGCPRQGEAVGTNGGRSDAKAALPDCQMRSGSDPTAVSKTVRQREDRLVLCGRSALCSSSVRLARGVYRRCTSYSTTIK